ncbi:hypothetical protein O7635_29630 [Asanoa sp. WMMD1127]|uniref:hypothetical protein n=1 Tax=Asanoa sp. WMMD1127 TaxID=3016107 RepID=UPI0024165642|nr:hypothetical protein [Asanoa sp. WMMD1127]MDG4826031.1 hypothetical protein [Asanoa sp. WMMD1127]
MADYCEVFEGVLAEARAAHPASSRVSFDHAIGTGDEAAEKLLSEAIDRAANRGLPPVDRVMRIQRHTWLRRQLEPDLRAYRVACKRLAGRPPAE